MDASGLKLQSGLWIEHVNEESLAAGAGLRAGDTLCSYNGIVLTSPAHLQALQENTTEIDPIRIEGVREARRVSLSAPTGSLGVQVRPWLSETVLEQYKKAKHALDI